MDAIDTSQKPRRSLDPLEEAVGEVVAGPNDFWRVPIDTATLKWNNGMLELRGEETRIVASGLTVHDCVQEFWTGFGLLVNSLKEDRCDLQWLKDENQRSLYKSVMEERLLLAVATPPNDGRPYDLHGEFWDGFCPQWKNLKPSRLAFPPW